MHFGLRAVIDAHAIHAGPAQLDLVGNISSSLRFLAFVEVPVVRLLLFGLVMRYCLSCVY